jgi:hypothetical protein
MSKPLVERSTDAVISTTHGLMRQARTVDAQI